MVGTIDINRLSLEELSGVVTIYPWFAAARMELCRRTAAIGLLSEEQMAATSLYVGSRSLLSSLVRSTSKADCSDKDVRQLISDCIPESKAEARPIYVVGGDYFSQSQYDAVRKGDDNVFSRYAAKAREEGYREEEQEGDLSPDFYTETLARLYLEQDCKEQAINIYSKLSLRYPEKSVYFAALIDEINKKQQ